MMAGQGKVLEFVGLNAIAYFVLDSESWFVAVDIFWYNFPHVEKG